MEIRKTRKRKNYSVVEKALLLEKYKTSVAKKTQWCAENVIYNQFCQLTWLEWVEYE